MNQHRKVNAETIERVMLLSYNKKMWDVYTVEVIRNEGREQ